MSGHAIVTQTTIPRLYVIRHGETAWSLSGRHTGHTDIPLTARGQDAARAAGQRIRDIHFSHVLTSPLQRARRTCELAGLGATAEVDPAWRSGITAITKEGTPRTFARNTPAGVFFATVAQGARRQIRFPPAPAGSSRVSPR